jgi:TonB-dependent SusC/RagA subfamily outer membrane receptor
MGKRFLNLTVIILLLSFETVAQPFRIFGKVTDDSTKSPIPFASVAISGLNLGTSTNINGEFLIKLDSLPGGLIFSHVSYEKQEIIVYSVDYVTISLKPRKVILDELVIEDDKAGEYPYMLITQALNNTIQKSRDWKYGLAYYRQTSTNAEDYSELYEIFYDTRYSSQGIMDWDIQEGRYAMKTGSEAKEYVFNKNFTLLSRLITMFQPETDEFVMPVNERVRELYYLNISELLDVEGRKIAVVNFTPKEDIHIPAMVGKLFIDIESFDILKLQGQFIDDNLDFIGLTNPQGSWENFTLNFEVAFNPRDDDIFLDYISMNQSFDYYVADQFVNKIRTNSFLTYFEYYQPEKFKRLGGRLMRFRRSDREILDRVGYNKRFWAENPIVLRTPVEDEIISSFEAANAFGSIYLNDRQQIQLDKDELVDDPFVQQLNIDLRKSRLSAFGEKVYLHFDKPYYASGETIWFNAYIVNLGSLNLTDQSGVLYVDFISPAGDVLMHKRLMVSKGICEGNIDIPKDMGSGNYVVRAYTNWMKNYDTALFFEKHFNIYSANDEIYKNLTKKTETKDFDVRFFPEGGHLIHNLSSQIAFKAVDTNGRGIEISGKIIGPDGKSIVELDVRHDGMGGFFLNPQLNSEYKAVVKYGRNEKEFFLPEVLITGYGITVNNLKDRNIQLLIKNTPDLDNTELYIIAHARGMLFHREKVTVRRGGAVVSIPKAKFPEGILQLTLFNKQLVPVSERLVFINNEDFVTASIEPDDKVLRPREKVSLKLQVKDQYGKAVRNTSFSMAVTDAAHLVKDETRESIKTNLLLTSDLKGKIANPGFYFLEDNRDTRIALDLVMLTHGWRRYTWSEIREGLFDETTYAHENGINISGYAIDKSNDPVSNAFLRFVPLNSDFFGLWEVTTGMEGKFELKGLIIPDSAQVIVKSVNDKGKSENVTLNLDETDKILPYNSNERSLPDRINDDILDYIDFHGAREREYALYDVQEKILLKEIVIKDYEIKREGIHGEPDNVIMIDDALASYSDIFQVLQGRVPGLQVYGEGMNAQIRIRGITSITGNNTPLFIIDGTPLATPMSSSMPNDTTNIQSTSDNFSFVNSAILTIPPRDVERIEVLKGTSAAIYGLRGANGVIAIYTRKGPSMADMAENNISEDVLYLPGFHLVKEFYSPNYDSQEEEHSKPDKRTTIYWNPSVKTNNLGYAEITFYNSDDGKRLQVDLEGITDYGDPVNMTTLIGEEAIK